MSLLLVTVIFVSGGLVGAGLAVIFQPQKALRGRKSPQEIRDLMTRKIADRIGLSDQQTQQVRQIMEERMKELQKLRLEIQPRMKEQAGVLHKKVSALLDNGQRPKWEKLYAEFHRKWFNRPGWDKPTTQPAGPSG
ncbi:MAG: hypothetical protein QF577_10375 [Phycisphaerae bacterium]|nr:hypothetical protein [Phycisphaerae bacterium]MDP7637937.1 hypothetical protein [Phycisphaerae bacterium]